MTIRDPQQQDRDPSLLEPTVFASRITTDLLPLPERRPLRPVPPALRKRGIERLETNLPLDHTIALPSKLIVTLFGRELLKAIAASLAAEQEEKTHANS